MKFDYETSSEDREVVAFIDAGGSLVIRNTDSADRQFVLHKALGTMIHLHMEFDPNESGVTKRFYRGDTIKITF